jgi:hypothetical protein
MNTALTVSVSALGDSSAGAFARRAGSAGPSAGGAFAPGAPWSSPPAPPLSVPAPSSPDGAPPPAGSSSGGSPAACSLAAGDGGLQSAAEALAFLSGALDYLAHADAAAWPEGLQADCLRVLAVAESQQAAAHAKVLSAFSRPGGGLAGDGHRSPRVWLSWQTQATRRAASTPGLVDAPAGRPPRGRRRAGQRRDLDLPMSSWGDLPLPPG